MNDKVNEIVEYTKALEGINDPMRLCNARIKIAQALTDLSEELPDLQRKVSEIKNEQINKYIHHRKDKSQKDAEMHAKWDVSADLVQAEYQYNRVKQVISMGHETLNAISSKVKVIEMQIRNQV